MRCKLFNLGDLDAPNIKSINHVKFFEHYVRISMHLVERFRELDQTLFKPIGDYIAYEINSAAPNLIKKSPQTRFEKIESNCDCVTVISMVVGVNSDLIALAHCAAIGAMHLTKGFKAINLPLSPNSELLRWTKFWVMLSIAVDITYAAVRISVYALKKLQDIRKLAIRLEYASLVYTR